MAKHTIATLLAALQLAAGQSESNLPALYPGGSPTSPKATTLGNVIGWGTPDGIERYYGIPIGESSAGANRFKPAVALTSYASDQNAFVEKRCVNMPGVDGTEDCISVDIVTASNLTGAPSACWLHGGGFVAIDYGTPYTRTTGFWPKDGVIQVALHYRLGLFGFGYFQEDVDNGASTSGNFGLTDAILELTWLRANIGLFGGDPLNLNVFGESGGAAFTTVLLAYPQLDTLVQGVAIQSPYISFGDASFSKAARATSTQMFVDVMTNFLSPLTPTCTDTKLACLRTIGTTETMPNTANISALGMVNGLIGGFFNPPWYVAAYTPNFFAFGADFFSVWFPFALTNNGGASPPDPNTGAAGDFPGADLASDPPSVGVGPMELLAQTWMWWWPVVDGELITQPPSIAYGTFNKAINVIVGQNENEVITFYPGGTNMPDAYTNVNGPPAPFGSADNLFTENTMPIDASNGGGGNPNSDYWNLMGDRAFNVASEMLPHTATLGEIYAKTLEIYNSDAYNAGYSALYGSIDPPITKAIQTVTDGILSKTTKGIVDALTSSGPRTGKVYRYLFAQGGPDWFAARKPGWGACHGCELTYILGLYEMGYTYPIIANFLTEVGSDGSAPSTTVEWTPAEYQVGTAMKAYWGNFFKTGDPNSPGSRRRLQAGLPVWQQASAMDMNLMVFNEGYSAGAELNPCLRSTACSYVPTKDYKAAEATFWKTGVASVAKSVCTGTSNVMALKNVAETVACLNPPPPPVTTTFATTTYTETSVRKDPHLALAHGGRADFKGQDGAVYNLLSSRNLSYNALFEYSDFVMPHKLVKGSFMSSVSIVARTWCAKSSSSFCPTWTGKSRMLHIEFNATHPAGTAHTALMRERGMPNVEVTGEGIHVDNVFVQTREHEQATSLVVNTGQWRLSATAKHFPNPDANPGRMLLHVDVAARYDADHDVVAPHGLIGQSYDGDNLAVDGAQDDYRLGGTVMETKAQAEGAIEGVAVDYRMSRQAFSTEFKFSRFDAVSAPHRNVTALSGFKRPRSNNDGVASSTTLSTDALAIVEADAA